MATIQFKALGKKDPVNLNIRFFHNKISCYAKSNIFINSVNWSNKTSKVKGLAIEEKLKIESRINEISNFIFDNFNKDFPIGENINSKWLVEVINNFYGKPKGEDDYQYYFVPFIKKYIAESETRLNPKTGKKISPRTIANYSTTLKRLLEFEDKYGKIKTKNVNLDFHNKFTSFVKLEGGYSGTLIEKYVSHIKHFGREAKISGYEVNSELESSKFTFKRDETLDTYLNEKEIDILFDLNLKDNLRLDNVRDLFIVGVWTGLRISDLKRINDFDFSNDRLKILSTEKNNSSVEIPIHTQLKFILKKRKGVLPEISEQKFNKYVKELCELAGINEVTLGSIKDPNTNRKVRGYYPKYKLISSHTCRRSFISNHYGKIDDKTLMTISTHKSVSQFLKYVKTTTSEHANKLEKYWKQKEKSKKSSIKMRVVN